MNLKTSLQVKWFYEIYHYKLSKIPDELTLEQICRQIWGPKYHLDKQGLLRDLVTLGGLKQTGHVRKIGKFHPIYKIDQDKMQQLLEESDVGKCVIEIFKDGKLVYG